MSPSLNSMSQPHKFLHFSYISNGQVVAEYASGTLPRPIYYGITVSRKQWALFFHFITLRGLRFREVIFF